jgi:peptide/nickel transport system permease protein
MIILRNFAKRFLMFAGGIVLILTTAFFAIYRLPGDPARMILGPRADAETIAQFRAQAGLDDSVWIQFARFSGRVARLDLGESLTYRRPVTDLIRERTGQTIRLVGYSMAIMLTFGVLVPVVLRASGLRFADDGLRAVWTGLSAAPPYVLALVTLTLLAGGLGLLPAVFEPDRLISWLAPAFVLAAYPTALVSRLFYDALESAMNSDYATRARAEGRDERTILLREAIVNALTAPVSAIANGLAYLFTGNFFVEVAFGVGGIGTLTYEAIRNKDVTVLAGVCLVFAVVISTLSTLLDLSQQLLNPRLRRSHAWEA